MEDLALSPDIVLNTNIPEGGRILIISLLLPRDRKGDERYFTSIKMGSATVLVIVAILGVLVTFYIALSCSAEATNLNSKHKKVDAQYTQDLTNDKNNMTMNMWLSIFVVIWLLLLMWVAHSYMRDKEIQMNKDLARFSASTMPQPQVPASTSMTSNVTTYATRTR